VPAQPENDAPSVDWRRQQEYPDHVSEGLRALDTNRHVCSVGDLLDFHIA
jgi:hypothetical protein